MMIIIIGMHRSGTSALAGLLHNNDIVMGEEDTFMPKPSQENIKGFYENHLFRHINDEIVEKCGYTIKSWDSVIPNIQGGFITKYRMRKLLEKYNRQYDKWGWKDPRTCITLGLWLEEIEKMNYLFECKIIFILRDPYAVANSIVKRGNTDYENALKLWLKYNEHALESIESMLKKRTCYLTYENLCKDPINTSRSVFEFLEHPFDENIVSQFIEPRLNRSSIIEGNCNISKGLTEKLIKLKEKVISRTI